eukprot:GDKI01002621.1.p1 GENE.GDKI01002621.1~~GDKI01002621.1.p1  ORF type:complete len:477 (-),score=119.44 GDKI01002621.1:156-1586(-)
MSRIALLCLFVCCCFLLADPAQSNPVALRGNPSVPSLEDHDQPHGPSEYVADHMWLLSAAATEATRVDDDDAAAPGGGLPSGCDGKSTKHIRESGSVPDVCLSEPMVAGGPLRLSSLEQLGKGSYATAYALPAANNSTEGKVLKLVRLGQKSGATAPEAFEREACLAQYAGAQDHGPAVYDYWKCDVSETWVTYGLITMQRLNTTWHKLHKYRAAPVPEQVALVRELGALIDLGLVHNDNHGGNIGYVRVDDPSRADTEDGLRLTMFDFGLTRELDPHTPVYQAMKSTLLSYMLRLFVHTGNMHDVTQEKRCEHWPYIMAVLYQLSEHTYVWGQQVAGDLSVMCPHVYQKEPELPAVVQQRIMKALRDKIVQEGVLPARRFADYVDVTRPADGQPGETAFSLKADDHDSVRRLPKEVMATGMDPLLAFYALGDAIYQLQDRFTPDDAYNCLKKAPADRETNVFCQQGMNIRLGAGL